jgi:hypothetical protein
MSTFIFLSSIGGGSTEITVVDNYAALLALPPTADTFYWCQNSQGTAWLPGSLGGTFYPKGIYHCFTTSPLVIEFIETPYQATQVEVDAGTVEDKFVTPKTFTDSAQLSTIRNPIFTVELMSVLTITFYAPFDMSIDTVTAIVNAPTTTIQVNGSAYTLADPINIGDEIEVTVDIAGVVNLTTTRL